MRDMLNDLKKVLYWVVLIVLCFFCVIFTLKILYYIFIILASVGLAVIIKILYEKYGRN
jgi:hypothetical protein